MLPSHRLTSGVCSADFFFGFSFIFVPFLNFIGQLAQKIPIRKINKLYLPIIVYTVLGAGIVLSTNEVSFALYKQFLGLGWLAPSDNVECSASNVRIPENFGNY